LAGKVVDQQRGFREWIRPISDRPSQEISEEERRFENGTDPKLLDIIQVEMIEPRPHAQQSENHLIDPQYYWKRRGTVDWKTIQSAIDDVDTLWVNGHDSYNGKNDRIPQVEAEGLDGSLLLIDPQNLLISVGVEGGQYRKRKVRATFDYKKHGYVLAVTDPIIERRYFAGEDGEYPIRNALLCVSLGEAFQNYCYKLVAAVITPEDLR
jgi:hypothetical protein